STVGRVPGQQGRSSWLIPGEASGYTILQVYLQEPIMQVSRWGNSLAVRLPAAVVAALDLREGDDVEIVVAGERCFEIRRKPAPAGLLARLRKYRGRLPGDFRFDRLEASERGECVAAGRVPCRRTTPG